MGLPVNPEWIIKLENFGSMSKVLAGKKDMKQFPDAFLLASSGLFLPFYTALQNIGLRMPDDISAIGFDDTPEASALPVPISVFAQPLYDIAHKAASALYGMARKTDMEYNGELETEFIIRSSCARSRKG